MPPFTKQPWLSSAAYCQSAQPSDPRISDTDNPELKTHRLQCRTSCKTKVNYCCAQVDHFKVKITSVHLHYTQTETGKCLATSEVYFNTGMVISKSTNM